MISLALVNGTHLDRQSGAAAGRGRRDCRRPDRRSGNNRGYSTDGRAPPTSSISVANSSFPASSTRTCTSSTADSVWRPCSSAMPARREEFVSPHRAIRADRGARHLDHRRRLGPYLMGRGVTTKRLDRCGNVRSSGLDQSARRTHGAGEFGGAQAAGVTRSTADVPGGEIVRDAAGEPTGLLKDNAMSLVESKVPPPSDAMQDRAHRRRHAACRGTRRDGHPQHGIVERPRRVRPDATRGEADDPRLCRGPVEKLGEAARRRRREDVWRRWPRRCLAQGRCAEGFRGRIARLAYGGVSRALCRCACKPWPVRQHARRSLPLDLGRRQGGSARARPCDRRSRQCDAARSLRARGA